MRFKSTICATLILTGLVAASTAHADLTIPSNALVANSVQAFSDRANKAFNVSQVTVTALGNATPVAGAALPTFNLPITSITIGSGLKIAGGSASGSALKLTRTLDDGTEGYVVLANFTINYRTKQVLADTTIPGVATAKQATVYNFNVATPLALKYKFPVSITGHEVLDTLMLTEEAKDSQMAGLGLPDFIRGSVLDKTDFGTLTQDIAVKFRPKAVSAAPYIVK